MAEDDDRGGPGQYRLVRKLAVGGMAEIWLARQTGIAGFEKQVVIKRTLPQHAGEREFVAMFLDEARLIASLHHPNIVQVHDIGVHGDRYFYVMEHLEGQDVGRVQKALERRGERMPLEHAIVIAMGAAAGLHAAHVARDVDGLPLEIVHRDVSPGNLVVTFDGSVKLIDFGVAKAARRRAVTRAGVIKGKVSFMSPEQLMCKPLDRRSDVFSLGILLYELTTGLRLFEGSCEFEIMKQIVERSMPRPGERVAGYPPALEAVVLRALARRPEDRFESAHDLFVALEEVAHELGLAQSQWALGRYVRELGALADDDATAPSVVASAVGDEANFDRMDTEASVSIDDVDDVGEPHVAGDLTSSVTPVDGTNTVSAEDEAADTANDLRADDSSGSGGRHLFDEPVTPKVGSQRPTRPGRDGAGPLRAIGAAGMPRGRADGAKTPTPAPSSLGARLAVGEDEDTAQRLIGLALRTDQETAPASPRTRREASVAGVRVAFRTSRPARMPTPPEESPLGTSPLPRLVPRPGGPFGGRRRGRSPTS